MTLNAAAAVVALTRFMTDQKQLMTSSPVRIQRPSGTTLLSLCELLASEVFEKIEISHLCNAQITVDPFEPQFSRSKSKNA